MNQPTSIGHDVFLFCARVRVYRSALALLSAFSLSVAASSADNLTPSFQTIAKNVDSRDYGVCLTAIDQLGRSHEERAVSVLTDAFEGEKRLAVRRAIVDALGLLRFDSGRSTLVSALKDPEAQVRQSAVIALEALGGSDDALVQQASSETDFAVKAHLVQILGRSKNPKALKRLHTLAQDSNSQMRAWAQKEIDRKEMRTTK